MMIAFFVMMCSCSTAVIVIYVIFTNKEIKNSHPSKLLALMSVCEFITCSQVFIWLVGAGKLACYFGMVNIYDLTLKSTVGALGLVDLTNFNALEQLVKGN